MNQPFESFPQGKQPRTKRSSTKGDIMKNEYDLRAMKSRKNPYSKHRKKQVTIRLGIDVIDYFKSLSEETGVPYQNLINSYLLDCAQHKKKPVMTWS